MTNLFVNSYQENNKERAAELRYCLQHNKDNKYIDNVFVIEKNRPTFNDYFDKVNQVSSEDDINIIANSDITFDESITISSRLNSGDVFALTRYDVNNGAIKFFNRRDSQDVWIFRGHINNINADFGIGNWGCDNALAYIIQRAGYNISNPSLSIKTYHHHASNYRTNISDGIRTGVTVPPPYLLLKPSFINGINRAVKAPAQRERATINDNYTIKPQMISVKGSGNLRVLYIGIYDKEPQISLRKALASLGEYYEIEWSNELKLLSIEKMNKQIVDFCISKKIDVVFAQIQRNGVIDFAELSNICFTINFTGDVREDISWYINDGKNVSLTLFTNETDVKKMKSLGLNAEYFPVSADEIDFYHEHREKDIDIVFIGNNYNNQFPLSEYRTAMIKFLKKTYGSRFKLYGNGWGVFGDGSFMFNHDKERSVYNRSKIAINLSHFDYERYSSDRLIRIMMSGTFCLSHKYKEIEKDFLLKGHLDVWSNFDELKNKIDYYLKNESEREVIAANGHSFSHYRCTWVNSINILKSYISEYSNGKLN